LPEPPPAGGRPPAAGAPVSGTVAPGSDQRAQQILARIIEKKGGAPRLISVKTLKATAMTTLVSPQGRITAETTTYIAYPEKFRVDAKLPAGEVVQAYVDGEAWIQSPTGVQQAPQAMRDEFRASVARDLIPLLLRASLGDARVRLLPERRENGTTLAGIEISVSDLDPIGLYVDESTGLVALLTYKSAGEAAEELFSDYRSVDGVQLAFKAVVRRRGTVVIERVVNALELNAPIDVSLFKKPS